MKHINMKFLRTFLAVIEERSGPRAAARLGIKYHSVTVHIAAIERAVGAPLLERRIASSKEEAGRMQLTAAGIAFLPKAIEAMATHDAMFDNNNNTEGEPDPREVNRITAISLSELLLDVLRHDVSDETRARASNLLKAVTEAAISIDSEPPASQ